MPDHDANPDLNREDPLARYRGHLQGQWLMDSAALVCQLRLRQAPTIGQVAQYLSDVIGPAQGNRKVGTKMGWDTARSIVKKIAEDLDEAMGVLDKAGKSPENAGL